MLPPFQSRGNGIIMGQRRTINLEQSILEAIRSLPPEKQKELLEHSNRLRQDTAPRKPFKSIKGLWADLNITLTAEEIEENQRQMWRNFPRDTLERSHTSQDCQEPVF